MCVCGGSTTNRERGRKQDLMRSALFCQENEPLVEGLPFAFIPLRVIRGVALHGDYCPSSETTGQVMVWRSRNVHCSTLSTAHQWVGEWQQWKGVEWSSGLCATRSRSDRHTE